MLDKNEAEGEREDYHRVDFYRIVLLSISAQSYLLTLQAQILK